MADPYDNAVVFLIATGVCSLVVLVYLCRLMGDARKLQARLRDSVSLAVPAPRSPGIDTIPKIDYYLRKG